MERVGGVLGLLCATIFISGLAAICKMTIAGAVLRVHGPRYIQVRRWSVTDRHPQWAVSVNRTSEQVIPLG